MGIAALDPSTRAGFSVLPFSRAEPNRQEIIDKFGWHRISAGPARLQDRGKWEIDQQEDMGGLRVTLPDPVIM